MRWVVKCWQRKQKRQECLHSFDTDLHLDPYQEHSRRQSADRSVDVGSAELDFYFLSEHQAFVFVLRVLKKKECSDVM